MERDTIAAINGKADQIDKLVSNLFHATLEELEHLDVNTQEISSAEINRIVRESDYLGKVSEIDIKDGVVLGDELRISQVIGNIIYNSYKYAGTEIKVSSRFEDSNLIIDISDKGGSSAAGKDGSGLGLYISKYLMEKMDGGMSVSNSGEGLTVTLFIKLA